MGTTTPPPPPTGHDQASPRTPQPPPPAGRPPAPAPQPAPSRNPLPVIAIVVIAVIVILFGAVRLGVLGDTSTEREEAFPDVTAVDFSLPDGGIELVGGQGDVLVHEEFRRSVFGGSSTMDVVDGRLELRAHCPRFRPLGFLQPCAGEYSVTIPPEVTVSGTSTNAWVMLRVVDGPVDVSTTNGEITIDAAAGPLDVGSTNGAVVGTDLSSSEVTATTTNGAIFLSFTTSPNEVVADSSNGDITVEVPDDGRPWAVDARTTNGGTQVDVATDPGADRILQVHTVNGSIEIRHAG